MTASHDDKIFKGLGVFPKYPPKKRYTGKAEKNAFTFVYVPPTYKRASPIKK